MSAYGALAAWYDALTRDVPYGEFADFYQAEFAADGGEFRLLLDLCCGTGTLTRILAERGYEMIGADASPDMAGLARANRDKVLEIAEHIVSLCAQPIIFEGVLKRVFQDYGLTMVIL